MAEERRVEPRTLDVIARHLDTVLSVERTELVSQDGFSRSVITHDIESVPVKLLDHVAPTGWPITGRLGGTSRSDPSEFSGVSTFAIDFNLDVI